MPRRARVTLAAALGWAVACGSIGFALFVYFARYRTARVEADQLAQRVRELRAEAERFRVSSGGASADEPLSQGRSADQSDPGVGSSNPVGRPPAADASAGSAAVAPEAGAPSRSGTDPRPVRPSASPLPFSTVAARLRPLARAFDGEVSFDERELTVELNGKRLFEADGRLTATAVRGLTQLVEGLGEVRGPGVQLAVGVVCPLPRRGRSRAGATAGSAEGAATWEREALLAAQVARTLESNGHRAVRLGVEVLRLPPLRPNDKPPGPKLRCILRLGEGAPIDPLRRPPPPAAADTASGEPSGSSPPGAAPPSTTPTAPSGEARGPSPTAGGEERPPAPDSRADKR
jgi:hypothetical protein